MKRVILSTDGVFVSYPGHHADDASVARVLDPTYRHMEQHAKITASSVHNRDAGSTSSYHRATVNFTNLGYVPIISYAMSWGSNISANTVRYPNYLFSDIGAAASVPQGVCKVGTNYAYVEALVNIQTGAAGLFTVQFIIIKSNSGLSA